MNGKDTKMKNQMNSIRRAASTRNKPGSARGVLVTHGPVRRAIYYTDPDPSE